MGGSQLSGNERFVIAGKETSMTVLDFWRWHFSEVYDLQDKIAEFIVARALGLEEAENVGLWTLYDMSYRGKRIEIKETSYYHAWQSDDEPKSKQRAFGITKAYSKYQDNSSLLARQNDIYVFCLNTGETRKESNPLEMNNWEFYVIPTSVIDGKCGDAKRVSLSKVRKLTKAVEYEGLKKAVDAVIDEME